MNGNIKWLIALAALGAPVVAIGIWVGTIQGMVTSHDEWIRHRVNLDSRMAVLEEKLGDVNRRLDRQIIIMEELIRVVRRDTTPKGPQ